MKRILAILAVVAAIFAVSSCDTALHDSPVYIGTLTITGAPTSADLGGGTSFKVTGSFGSWVGKSENDVAYDGKGTITIPLSGYFPPSWAYDQVPSGVVPSADLPIKIAIVKANGDWISDDYAKWYGLPKAQQDITVTWSDGK